MTSRWTLVDGMRFHALGWTSAPASARRPPIVLVHGLGLSSRYMIPTGERLAASHHVYAPDLPGFGRSQTPRHPYSIEQHARALGGWIEASGIHAPVLVGNSYGCQVIAQLAVLKPTCAVGLVLSAPTVENTRRSVLGEARRLLRDAPRERLALVPIVLADYLRTGPRRIVFTLLDAIADRIEEKLERVSLPTLLVRGERDPIVSAEWMTFLAGRMPSASVLTLDGAPHAVNFSAAPSFVAAVIDFVESLASADRQER